MSNNRRRLQGRVVSDKMDKTVVVEIERLKPHRIYKKVVRTSKRVMAHDETNAIPIGAIVRIVESKPLSKRKRWAVEQVIEDPGNKVVTTVSDEQEVVAVEHIGLEDNEPENTPDALVDDAPEADEAAPDADDEE